MTDEAKRPHPIVRRLSAATRRAVDRGCSSLRRVVRDPTPFTDQAAAWLRRGAEPSEDAPADAPLTEARRREAVALLGLSEVDRAAQACTEAISTLEEEMEEDADAVVALRGTIGKLSSSRTDLEAERSRLLEQHRDRKAERVALERGLGAEEEDAPRRTAAASVGAAFEAAGEKVTDLMDAVTDAVGRRIPFARR